MKNKLKISVLFLAFALMGFTACNEKIKEPIKSKSGKINLTKNVFLNWKIKDFNKTEHEIEYCESIDAKYICKIDDKDYFGSDFRIDLPKNELESLSISIDNKSTELDASQIYNPNYSGELNNDQFKLVKKKDYYILYAYFSDGAGTYTTNWKIKNGKAQRGKLSSDEDDFTWQNE